MEKELETLSKYELIKIANHYNIYNPENMDKKEIIGAIIDANGIDVVVKKPQPVKGKKTNEIRLQKLSLFLFMLTMFVMIASQLFTLFYFGGAFDFVEDTLLVVLSVGVFVSFIFIYIEWERTRLLKLLMATAILISIGWFIYYMVGYHKEIIDLKKLKDIFINNKIPLTRDIKELSLYTTMFYVWIGFVSSLASLSAGALLLKKIIY